jgi:hypothetical protein
MDMNKHLQNSKKIKKILGSGPSCWKWRGICMPPCICFGACFNFFLVVWGRYLEGIHWVYGKKTMWSILENGMSTLVSIWLSKMLCWLLCCVSLLSNTLGKSLKGLHIYGLSMDVQLKWILHGLSSKTRCKMMRNVTSRTWSKWHDSWCYIWSKWTKHFFQPSPLDCTSFYNTQHKTRLDAL